MQDKCTPQDAAASTPAWLEGGALQKRREQEEALRRFNDASRAFYLLVESKVAPRGRLEKASRSMDEWASRFRS